MIWIVGAGNIAIEYNKVLSDLGKIFLTIGRGENSAKKYESLTGNKVILGGISNFLKTNPLVPDAAIIALQTPYLASTCIMLMEYGVRRILCEKPGFCNPEEIENVRLVAEQTGSELFYAYNRRFFSSVLKAEEIIEADGGLLSFNFEFTEWGHIIEKTEHPLNVKQNWLFVNSTHVIDLAFFIGGKPEIWSAYSKDEFDWHKPINFSGAGKTEKGVLFNYQANWNAPGRWSIELLTSLHRIYLKPMETIQLQDRGSVNIYPIDIDDHLDKKYKPGFYLETKAFIEKDYNRLCSIRQQSKNINNIYHKIAKG